MRRALWIEGAAEKTELYSIMWVGSRGDAEGTWEVQIFLVSMD